MESPMESPSHITDDLVFRASKRRKVNRQRVDSKLDEEPITHIEQHDEEQQQQQRTSQEEPGAAPEESDHEELGLNYVIRARKQQQRRRGGIEFTATRPALGDDSQIKAEAAQAREAAASGSASDMSGMSGRFAAQTGYKVQVDSHMMAYIDAELAKRNLATSTATPTGIRDSKQDSAVSSSTRFEATTSSPAPGTTPHQPPSATTGLIQEVDLPARNASTSSRQVRPPPAPRVRLGPDGKPWRSRKPRRTSQDLKRDALVESLLQEHGLNAFDNSELGTQSNANGGGKLLVPGANEDADERAAAEFQRQFLEAAEERRTMATAHMQAKQKNAPVGGEIAGGPKLGGSRSQRAKMHALELEREKDKKAGKR